MVFNIYNTTFPGQFNADFAEKAKIFGMQESELAPLTGVDFEKLMQIGAKYADFVVQSEPMDNASLPTLYAEKDIPYLPNNEAGIEAYHEIYKKLAHPLKG